jgi:hypothetical protein
VVAIVRHILEDDFAEIAPSIERQTCEIAYDLEARPVRVHPHCGGLLIAASSGGGKSTIATAIVERIVDQGFQLCAIDAEGDYTDLDGTVVLGDAKSPPGCPRSYNSSRTPRRMRWSISWGSTLPTGLVFCRSYCRLCRVCASRPRVRIGWSSTRPTTCCHRCGRGPAGSAATIRGQHPDYCSARSRGCSCIAGYRTSAGVGERGAVCAGVVLPISWRAAAQVP